MDFSFRRYGFDETQNRFYQWLRLVTPYPIMWEPAYSIIAWTLTLFCLGSSYLPVVVGILLTLVDFLYFLPRILHGDNEAGMLEYFWTTPVSTREVLVGIIKWIVPLNLRHIFPALLLTLIYVFWFPSDVLNPELLVLYLIGWFLILGAGLVSVGLPRWVVVTFVPVAAGIGLLMVLIIFWCYIVPTFFGKLASPENYASRLILIGYFAFVNIVITAFLWYLAPIFMEKRRRGAWGSERT